MPSRHRHFKHANRLRRTLRAVTGGALASLATPLPSVPRQASKARLRLKPFVPISRLRRELACARMFAQPLSRSATPTPKDAETLLRLQIASFTRTRHVLLLRYDGHTQQPMTQESLQKRMQTDGPVVIQMLHSPEAPAGVSPRGMHCGC